MSEATIANQQIERLLEAAHDSLLSGDLAKASALYRAVLTHNAGHPTANYWAGVLALKSASPSDAVVFLERAVAADPSAVDFQIDLGLACLAAGAPERGERCFQMARQTEPHYADLQLHLIDSFEKSGKAAEAAESAQRGLLLFPNDLRLLRKLAELQVRLNQWPLALKTWQSLIQLQSDCAVNFFDFGQHCYHFGDLELAAAAFRRAIKLQPNFVNALLNLGLILQKQDKFEEALDCFQRARSLNDADPPVHKGLGDILAKLGRWTDAIAAWRRALGLSPQYADAWQNLGLALEQQNRLEEALACHERVVELRPDDSTAHRFLGMIHHDMGRLDVAQREYDRALQLNPNDPEIHWQIFTLMAQRGEFPQAWQEYEWRWHVEHRNTPNREFPQPRWDGSPLNGRVILLWPEQGFGDMIQIARYLPLVRERGGRILLWIQPDLKTILCTACDGIDVFSHSTQKMHFDTHLPLMSLPRVLGTTLETIPRRVPYLRAPTAAPSSLFPEPKRHPRIGLVWCGSRSQTNDRRPVPFECLLPLLELDGFEFYSLQAGASASDVQRAPLGRIVDLSAQLTDFAKTAAIIEQLDLIITIDTSVAHLAGALGKPTWTLLSFAPDWRWMREREDSPWYPTMRLFRQTRPGQWTDVIERVRQELSALGVALKEDASCRRSLSQGIQLHQAGELDQAAAFYQRVLDVNPSHAEALRFLGVVRRQQGDFDSARQLLETSIAIQPISAEAHHDLGLVWFELGQFQSAIASYRRAVEIRPIFPEAHYHLGNAHCALNQRREAQRAYRFALEQRPDFPEAHYNLGWLAQEEGDPATAAVHYRSVLDFQPAHIDALLNLGLALKDSGQLPSAEECLRKVLELQPEHSNAKINLAAALVGRADRSTLRAILEQAQLLCDEVIAREPNLAEAWSNLGVIQQANGDLSGALTSLQRAVDLKPKDAEACFNFGIAQLLAAQFKEGWNRYEARFETRNPIFAPRPFTQPRWRGEDLKGATLLAHAEQGLGDAIQFVRYVPLLAQRGARVVLECPDALKRLFSTVQGADSIIARDTAPPPYQFHVPLMSLPLLFQTTIETIPGQVPYLSVPSGVSVQLPQRGSKVLRVGLVWSGNPGHAGDRLRSIHLQEFSALLRLDSIQIVSLQTGPAAEQISQVAEARSVINITDQLTDFAATAAVVESLDLIIAVDTAVAHLAGALGKPLWILLPFAPDWRWLLNRSDSPWYPTARLFRQPAHGDWSSVIANVVEALRGTMKQSVR